MNVMKILILVALFWLSFSSAAQSNSFDVRLVISAEQVQCELEVVHPCFQAKKETDPYWTMTIDAIQNFDFEPGFEYVLDLKVEHLSQPMQDVPSINYTLVNIVEKRAVN